MKQFLLLLSVVGLFWLFPSTASATHMAGGELTYEYLGGDTFLLRLTTYRDCSGNAILPPSDVRITSSCTGTQTVNLTLQNGVAGTEVSQICPTAVSICNGGPQPGMLAFYFEGIVVLSTHCSDYLFSYREANRNVSVNVFNSINRVFHIDASLNSSLYPNNSSPVFTGAPIPYVCSNQTVNYNYGVVENDGDSLSYALVSARFSNNAWVTTNCTYNAGYSATAPIAGVTINSSTGELSFTPSAVTGSYIVVAEVTEYNGAGAVISTVQRDIQFVVIGCSNQIPANPTSASNLVSTVGTASFTDSLEITANVGDQFCFDVTFSDINATDTLTVLSNASVALPGATMTTSGINPVTATVCWTVPAGMNTNNTVTFQVSDSACPVSGLNSLAFQVIIPPPSGLTAQITPVGISCNGLCDGSASAIASGGVGPYSYQWQGLGTTGCCQGNTTITGLCPGDTNVYSLLVIDLGDPDPSTNFYFEKFSINGVGEIITTNPTVTDDDCTTNCVGAVSVFVVPTTGTPPLSYLWNSGQTSTSITNVCAGTYTLTITDAANCTKTVSAIVQAPVPPTVVIDSTDSVNCFGGNDGAIYARAFPTCGPSVDACVSPTSVALGTGTATNLFSTYPAPYGNANSGARHQMLFTAAELTAAGVLPGTISSFAMEIAGIGTTLSYADFTIKMGCTSATDLTGGWVSGLTEVFTPKTHVVSVGWNTHDFDVKYFWDGISNIVIETCFNNPSATGSGNALTKYTPTTNQSVRYYADNTLTVCSSTNLTATSANRPNVRFGNCASTFTYAWSPAPAASQTTATVNNLTAQTYTVTVTSVGDGCQVTETATVNEPAIVDPTITLTAPVSCAGQCDASISVSAVGGQAPYVYTWNNGLAPGATQTNLCAGTYIVTATDAKLCEIFDTIVIVDPPTITASTTINTVISCNGVCDGNVTVSGTGGTAPLVVSWPSGAIGGTQGSLCAGTYDVTVTDASGCFVVESVNLTEPAVLTVSLATVGSILCNGDNTVTINSTVAGGTTNYSYLWSNTSTTPNLTNVGAGSYTLTVTDAQGCTATDNVTLVDPPLLVGSIVQNGFILCNGDLTGSLLASAIGGTPNYTYAWSNSVNTALNANIGAGAYSVTITDDNGCTDVKSFTINEPSALLANLTIDSQISCNGVCDGAASVAPSGGSAPYTVAWPAGVTNTGNSATGLCGATNYVVTITDNNGCDVTETINLTEPTLLTSSITLIQGISCGGLCDAQITAVAAGGTPNYTYSWSNGSTGAALTGLCFGSYTVTITDANGCTSSSNINVTQPAPVVASIAVAGSILCFGDETVTLTASAVGGTPNYSYVWSNGVTTAVNANVGVGSYTVTVTDANGCTGTMTQAISGPTDLTLSGVVNNMPSCNGVCDGSATVTAGGGTPGYTFTWPGGLTGATQNALCDGSYVVTVTDANACTETVTINIIEPFVLSVSNVINSQVSCNGVCDGSATISTSGGTAPITVTWPSGSNNGTETTLCDGSYVVTATDASGCSSTTTVVITEPAVLDISLAQTGSILCNGDNTVNITSTVTGGTTNYSYTWSNGASSANLTNVGAGVYSVTVTDANLCTDTASITVTEPAVLDVTISQTALISCGGAPTASLLATGTGGTLAYSFSWSNSANTPAISNLVAGTYTVTITDANLCTDTASFIVLEPTPVVANPTMVSAVSCNGVCDGSVTHAPTGGTAPYTIAWPAGITVTADTATGLCGATQYVVTITDANSCQILDTVNLTEPTPVTATINLDTPISCNGVCDAQITATGVGGTGTYTYAWSNGSAGATINGLCAGTYTVTATDANGCTGTNQLVITEPALIVTSIAQTGTILCFGDSTVTLTASSVGGTPNYGYVWNTGATTAAITNMGAGVYSVTTTDANGCSVVTPFSVTGPSQISITNTINTPISCNGVCDGSVTLTAANGTAGYTYAWPGGLTGATQNALCAGTYIVTVTDANACSQTDTVILTEPTAIVANPTIVSAVSCNGVCDGSVTHAPTGGTAPYTIAWPAGVALAADTATGLCGATQYVVTITDANNCQTLDTVNLTEPTAVTVSINLDAGISCGAVCDAQVTATGAGGTGTYTYAWSNGISGGTINNLCAGTYTVTATDANGCTGTNQIVITQPTPVVTTIAQTGSILCFGDSTVTLTATTSGGTPNYTYLWNTGSTAAVLTNTGAGVYSVTTTDNNGCSVVTPFTVNGPADIVLTANVTTPISCNGLCDASAVVIAVGGTPGMTFTWPSGATGPSQSNLCAGDYVVTVTDANSCSDTITVSIVEPNGIVIITNVTSQASCNGVCDGEVDITISGGTAPLTVAWPSGGTGTTETGLCAGSHTVTVTDVNGCSNTATVLVTEPAILALTLTQTANITCNGSCDGVVSATVSGGTAPYSVVWPGNDTTNVKTGLCQGSYTVTVEDANGCTGTQTIVVSEPAVLSVTTAITNAISCNGVCDGEITATIVGGTAPYTTTWSNGSTSLVNGSLCIGTYSVTITDASGCTATTAATTLTEPAPITANQNGINALCGICNGSIILTGTSGGDGGPYTYNWSGGNQLPGIPTITLGLCPGTYTVTVTDGSGCSVVLTETISNFGGPTAATFTSTNPTCAGNNDGAITVAPAGGLAPYSFLWSSGGTSATETGLVAGIYSVTITDDNGCVLIASDTLVDPSAITNVETIIDASCNGVCDGSIALTTSGGAGTYTYLWNTGATGNSVSSLCAGTYTVITTDANNCTKNDTFVVGEPTIISLTLAVTNTISCNGVCDGEITATVSGGTAPYSITWSNGGAGAIAVGLCAGSYTATVTDASGCTQTATLPITEPAVINATLTPTDATCGACDGQLAITNITGGDGGPYTLVWSNSSTTPTITSLCPGTYSVTITDGSGCSSVLSSPISNVGGPGSATLTASNPTCNGVCDGSINASPIGGTAPYTFAWSSGGNIATETGLCAGIYTVTITDATGCVLITSDTLTEPSAIINTEVTVDASCNGVCDGTIALTTVGGTGTHTYAWSNSATGSSISGLCAGSYTVTTTDASGCSVVNTYTIGEPSAITINLAITNAISCNGVCDGEITASVSGGSAPYTILWSNAGSSLVNSGLCDGSYTITVTDVNGCSDTSNISISEPAAITATITPTNATCGVCDGVVAVTNPAGGDGGPYTFAWSNGASTATSISNLCPGTYSVTITDGSGCTAVLSSTVSNLGGPTSATFASTNPSCNGVCDGTITVTPVGGTAPFGFAWSSGGTTASETALCDGIYSVTITDASGCVLIVSDTLTEPTSIVNTETITQASCNGTCDGTISLVTSGGTPTYSYAWSNSATGSSVSGLCAGAYSVTVTDGNGCTQVENYTITEPGAIVLATTTVDANCFNVCDGSATVTASGGTAPIVFVWSTGEVGATASNLCGSTTYSVTATDVNGCSTIGTVNIGAPAAIIIDSVVVVNAACGLSNGSATAYASGGTGALTYTWNGTSTANPLVNVAAGNQILVVSDANGCSVSLNVPISNDLGPAITVSGTDLTCFGDNSGTATVVVAGSSTYSYLWSTGGTNTSITGLSGGSYFVEVTDIVTGCIAVDTVTISEPNEIIINNVITQSPTCGSANGGALAFATGGTGTLAYSWNGTVGNPLINAAAGTYTLIVTDVSGCTAQTVIPLSDSGVFVANATGTDLLCFGASDGTASVTISPAGGGPYNYQWTSSPTDVTANVSGLVAGTYGVFVTDPSTGCSASDTITINEPTQISIDNVIVTNPSCGASDGALQAVVSGGTPGYTYSWNGTLTGNPITNIAAGAYLLEVTDANGCLVNSTIPLSDVGALAVAFTTTDVPCDGSCVGTATANASGGTGPFNYVWSNGDLTQTATGLCAGQVIVTVTDAAGGCVAVDTVTINQSPGLIMSVTSTNNTNCGGICDGTATAAASGSTGTITYVWSTGVSTPTITGLCAGTYTVTASDASGCTAIDSVTITDDAPLTLAVDTAIDATCLNSNDGEVQVTVTGGIAPYTFAWTSTTGFTSSNQNITLLLPGTYYLNVTDANGCIVSDSAVVNAITNLSVTLDDQFICNGADSVLLSPNVTGDNGTIIYQWYNVGGGVVGNDSTLFVTTPSDTTYYIVEVVSAGCSAIDTGLVAPGQIPDVDAGIGQTIVVGQDVTLGGNPTTSWGGSTFAWSPSTSIDNPALANPVATPTQTTLYEVEVTNIVGCTNVDTILITVVKKLAVISGFTPNGDDNNDTWALPFISKYPSATVEVYNRWGQLMFQSTDGYKVPWDGTFEGQPVAIGTYYYVIDLKDGDFPDPLTGPITIMR